MPRGRKKGAKYTSATRRLMIAALLMADVPERTVARATGAARETVREVHRSLEASAAALVPITKEAKTLRSTRSGATVDHQRLVMMLTKRAAFELVHDTNAERVLANLAGVVLHPEHLPNMQKLMEKAKEERCRTTSVTSSD